MSTSELARFGKSFIRIRVYRSGGDDTVPPLVAFRIVWPSPAVSKLAYVESARLSSFNRLAGNSSSSH
ncbi:hypothetical protein [Subtercola frigoramans]|uniref:Uncharacterized protein n=1 Tax=Subtercola frigoramans TaxID=120298 RepID=A0ABS2L0F5_9MICO|nr:hypothetical protein [Subtercola frigoramans]MBM7470557.1 hypothetical protein [Subtercola frigoramans]